MWILWTLVSFAVLSWLGYAWFVSLSTKYEHTAESRAILVLLAILAFMAGWKISSQIAPGWSLVSKGAVSLGLAFVLFTIISYIVVNLWCTLLTREYDERVLALEEEQDILQRRLEALRWQAVRGNLSRGIPIERMSQDGESRGDEYEERRKLIERVEKWQQGGGAARVRSLKVLEWKGQISKSSVSEIKKEIEALSREIGKESDEVKKEQAKIKLALLKIELIERGQSNSKRNVRNEETTIKNGNEQDNLDEINMRRRLQEIHREIQAAQALKREFLRGRIRLTWRVRS